MMDITAELRAMFTTDAFSFPAVFATSGGNVEALVIEDAPTVQQDLGESFRTHYSTEIELTTIDTDTHTVRRGDTVSYNHPINGQSVTYRITGVFPDRQGFRRFTVSALP